MVFELPVVDYPETPPVVHMGDYELFRPFLHSKFLRFSYGSDKGRPREQWQKDAVQWGPSHLVTLLEKYGFSAVLINRKGYEDRGMSILDGFRAAGRTNVLVDSGDFICVALQPALRPVLPPEFASGWYGLEGTAEENWHWSSGDAKIVLRNVDSIAKPVHLTFDLATLKPRFINIMIGAQRIYQTSLTSEAVPRSVEVTVTLAPGENELRFATDVPADFPSNGDPRKLAFTVHDFNVSE
jgi:phosphoglycerol transferase